MKLETESKAAEFWKLYETYETVQEPLVLNQFKTLQNTLKITRILHQKASMR